MRSIRVRSKSPDWVWSSDRRVGAPFKFALVPNLSLRKETIEGERSEAGGSADSMVSSHFGSVVRVGNLNGARGYFRVFNGIFCD